MINSRSVSDLVPKAQTLCQSFLKACTEAGIRVKIIQTLRDAEYQNSLYKIGRRGIKSEKIVTWKDGIRSKSNHQSGTAWDAVPTDESGNILWSRSDLFRRMADIAVSQGIRSGFYWKAVDSPHFEIDI